MLNGIKKSIAETILRHTQTGSQTREGAIKLDTPLVDFNMDDGEGEADNTSILLAHVIDDIQNEFKIKITDEEFYRFKKVRDIFDCVKNKLAQSI